MSVLSQLELDGVNVMPYAQDIARPAVPTIMVRVDQVEPLPEARRTHRLYQLTLILLGTSEDNSGPADDELDGLLEEVLYVLDVGAGAEMLPRWSSAKRTTYWDTTPAYDIAANLATTNPILTP